ncbi:MAG: glycosyltransferase family A protein [Burkholderiales bacterium]|nr:glycosyltransferase family A protein [Burkholderiales bacterium]
MSTTPEKAWPVAVFAHNEERGIIACLDSVLQAATHPIECYVLANACTDGTEALVAKYREDHPNVQLVSIRLGDKANAWNVFVHDAAPAGAEYYFFVDGDVRASAAAIDALAAALVDAPQANGASALPYSGRNVKQFRGDMLREKGLAGNLYALRGSFMERLRAQHICMPVGVIGEDALVGAMLKWDLSGDTRWDNNRIAMAEKAGFEFDPMQMTRLSNWKKYFRRRVRYSLREFQNRILGPSIKEKGFTGLPACATDLYKAHPAELVLRWRGVDTFFDWLALREIREAMMGMGKSKPGNLITAAHEEGKIK